jgi:hypothetical protein
MVPSLELAIATDGERLSGIGFSLGKIIRFRSLEFIINYIGGLRLSPRRDSSYDIVVCPTRSGPPSPLRAMIGESTEEFHIASDGEGGIDLSSPRMFSYSSPKKLN